MIRKWKIIIHFGGHIQDSKKEHMQQYTKVYRTLSWVCGQLAENETPITSIHLEICQQSNFGALLNALDLVEETMDLLRFHARQRRAITGNSIGMILSRLRECNNLQVTVDGRSRTPRPLGLLQDKQFYLERVCAAEQCWDGLHLRAEPYMKISQKLKDQVYGLWNSIEKREAFNAEREVVENTLQEVSEGKALRVDDGFWPRPELHDVYLQTKHRRVLDVRLQPINDGPPIMYTKATTLVAGQKSGDSQLRSAAKPEVTPTIIIFRKKLADDGSDRELWQWNEVPAGSVQPKQK
ncbi:MAG: hypothetical protein Q9174_002263 [Haloplaca sp. 1 TL-2023]